MRNLFNTLTLVLSDKRVSVLIIFIAIAARCIQLLFYLDSFFDTSFQVIATQNLVEGNGISTAIVKPGDLSAVIFQPLINWPPGYTILLTPFYIACGHDYLVACYILDVLAAASIILLTRRILFLLNVSLPVINLFTLLNGFFIYYFFFTGSTDSIAIAFFLCAVCLVVSAIRTNHNWNRKAAFAGLFLFLSASMKYLFFPVVFTLPIFLFIYGYQNLSVAARRAAFIAFVIAGIGIAALYLYQKSISGTGTYISATGRGFFPEHLLRLHPFIPAAFLTPNSTGILAGDAKITVMNTFRIVHVLLFTALLIIAAVFFFRSGLKKAALPKSFFFLSFSLMFSISLVLVLLSLVVDKELIPPDRWWTYVEDPRYYGLADILVHLCIFVLFYHYRKQTAGFFKYIIIALPFLLLPEAMRGIAFTAKRLIHIGKEEYYWKQDLGFQRYAASVVRQQQDSLQVKKVVVTGSLYYANYRASLHQQVPVLEEPASVNDTASLKTKEPVILLVMLSGESRSGFQSFINNPRTKLAGTYNRFYFYTLHVTPD